MTGFNHLHRDGLFVAVEGNIAVGKSTFCKRLRGWWSEEGRPTLLLEEPSDVPLFKQLLELYYRTDETRQRWAFTLQASALALRIKQHLFAVGATGMGTTVIQDRSIFADGCFGLACKEAGYMNDQEWKAYTEIFGAMKVSMRYPDVMVYLRASPERCCESNNRRAAEVSGRQMEDGIPLAYFQEIHHQHEKMIEGMKRYTRVVEVDWEQYDKGGSMVEKVSDEIHAAMEAEYAFIKDAHRL